MVVMVVVVEEGVETDGNRRRRRRRKGRCDELLCLLITIMLYGCRHYYCH